MQGVFKAHRDVPPIEDERRLRHDLTLQLPQPGVPIRENRRRCAEADTGAHNRVGEFVRRIAIASKGEAPEDAWRELSSGAESEGNFSAAPLTFILERFLTISLDPSQQRLIEGPEPPSILNQFRRMPE